MESKKAIPLSEGGAEFDDKAETLTLSRELLERMIERLNWIIQPELLYVQNQLLATEQALTRCQLRARDLADEIATYLPHGHDLMDLAVDKLSVLETVPLEPAIQRDMPGRASSNYRNKRMRRRPKLGGMNG